MTDKFKTAPIGTIVEWRPGKTIVRGKITSKNYQEFRKTGVELKIIKDNRPMGSKPGVITGYWVWGSDMRIISFPDENTNYMFMAKSGNIVKCEMRKL